MANPKGHPETLIPGQGRPKGSLNKFTNLKTAFLDAFEEIGGKKELAKWAKDPKNRSTFYQMLARKLPRVDAETTDRAQEHLEWLTGLEERVRKKGRLRG